MAKSVEGLLEIQMQTLSAKDAKYSFGRLIDLARAEPVAVSKHGRAVVVVMAIEAYDRLKAPQSQNAPKIHGSSKGAK